MMHRYAAFFVICSSSPDIQSLSAMHSKRLHLPIERPAPTMVIDYAIPGLSGLALARQMRRIAPWVNTLIISGHRSVETECRCEHGFAFLPKPFGTADVLQALEKIDAERTKLPKRATGVYPASPALAFTIPRAAGA
jgi:DNA-binding NtrC family response regulator